MVRFDIDPTCFCKQVGMHRWFYRIQVARFSRLPAVLTDGDGERNKEMDRHNVDIKTLPPIVYLLFLETTLVFNLLQNISELSASKEDISFPMVMGLKQPAWMPAPAACC